MLPAFLRPPPLSSNAHRLRPTAYAPAPTTGRPLPDSAEIGQQARIRRAVRYTGLAALIGHGLRHVTPDGRHHTGAGPRGRPLGGFSI
jgi:hypothetical protein